MKIKGLSAREGQQKTGVAGAGKESPFLAARREWNERYGSYISRAHSWKLVALSSLGVSIVLGGGVIYDMTQSRVLPFVVQVNKLGVATAIAPASEASMPNQQVISATLARFIVDVRSVWPDRNEMYEHQVKPAYNYILSGSQAQKFVTNYITGKLENIPAGFVRTVKIESVLPVSKTTWQVNWSETTTGQSNHTSAPVAHNYRAMLNIRIVPSTTSAAIMKNPLGVYIKDITWSPII
ncbi:MAG: VirB8/TrbF family protein [Cellulomonas sp.]